ncbi:growth factor receptor-bound protein 2-like [Ruditapes philippinarum]|uniref:growth factor receptor-bound protein 2-like n=1 Tax=Ruditapes philippinarum TaxID=129788 RepID=UPI00295C0F1A|nr:growth factor receptor-bound protein 2-like [Ruditapes philippinarum]
MPDEVEIKAGEIVTVWEKCNEWFRGETGGRSGYFPGNYVQKAEDDDQAAPLIGKTRSPDTIQLRRSMLQIRTDTITTHYVHVRDIEQRQTPGSPVLSTEREESAHQDHIFHVQSCQDMISVPQQKPEKFIAMWDYKPTMPDEIEIKEGNVVTVLEKCSSDWFLAEVSGRRGYIP